MALAKHEAKLLEEAFKGLVSKVGGATENPVRRILKKQASKPRPTYRRPDIFSKYSEFATKLMMDSAVRKPTNYGQSKTFLAG